MANLSDLSPSEYEKIANVLKRDRELRLIEETRLRQLRQDLIALRKRNALKPGVDPLRYCSRCMTELGRILNRGALCPVCLKKVCKNCREYGDESFEWLCIYCYKHMQLKAFSGEWMMEFGRLSLRQPNADHFQGMRHDVIGNDKDSFYLSIPTSPQKPPRPLMNSETLLQSTACVPDGKEAELNLFFSEDMPLYRQESCTLESPPMPRINPWTDIETEPTIPVRINKCRQFVTLHESENSEMLILKDRQSLEEGHCTLYSHSINSDIMDENEFKDSASTNRKQLNTVKNQNIPDHSIDDQQHSVETMDSGVFSPSIKTEFSIDINPPSSPAILKLSSNDRESLTHCLASESSFSETDEDHWPRHKISENVYKKRKSTYSRSDEKHSVHSADESGNSLRSSPHGRLRMRNRSLSGGSEDGRQRKTSVPQISVSECLENQPSRLSSTSTDKDNSGIHDEDIDQPMAYHCRSQMSLSSFGGRSESVTSVYSAAGGGRYGTVIVTGDVLFSLSYNYKLATLEINIKECRNLAPVDTKRNRSDPYVKVYLLPDRTKSGKRKTKVKKHTLNPVFDELLKFHVTTSELEIRTLWLSVWHSDRFGRNDFLGEVMLPLSNDNFESSGLKWYPLQERLETLDTPISYKGDLILALKYVPPDVTSRKFSKKPCIPVKGALEVLVHEARNLMATRSNGTSDPFCKSYLLPDKSKGGKQKTPVFKKSCNPKWNHTFVYDDVSLEDLRERCLELTIWDYDKITSNDFLGGVRLCLGAGKYQGRDVDWMDSVGEERSLWYTMLERPNTWVDGSLLLRPSMQSRRTM